MRWKLPLLCASLLAAACASDGATIEPEHLSLRDLLGVSPEQAMQWSEQERAQARKILASNRPSPGEEHLAVLGWGRSEQEWVLAGVAAFDGEREYRREAPVAFATAKVEGERLRLRAHPAPTQEQTPGNENEFEQVQLYLEGWQEAGEAGGWGELPQHAQPYLQSLARMESPLASTSIVIRPAVQEPFAALYVPPGGTASVATTRRQEPGVLLVNPVLLAALDPTPVPDGALLQSRERDRQSSVIAGGRDNYDPSVTSDPRPVASGGNPYSFFGSVSECAAAERLRCEGCLPGGTCDVTSRDAASGNAECEALSANDGRGYFLYCANLSLAIATVADCAGEDVPQCPAVTSASNQLLLLDANSQFVDNDVCRQGLDSCLAGLYGEPDDDFPQAPLDGGVGPGPTPPAPRQTDVSCGEQNCDFSPQCSSSCGGASCGDSFNCGGCGSDSDSGGGSGGGGCGGGSGGGGGGSGCSGGGGGCGGDGCGGGCGGCDSDSGEADSGGGCGGSDGGGGGGGSSCSGGDSGGGGCGGGGGSCGGDSCGGDSCGGSSCSNCSSAGQRVRAQWSLAMTVLWALLPLFFLSGWLRKEQADGAIVNSEESP